MHEHKIVDEKLNVPTLANNKDIAGNLQSKPVIPQECGRVRELLLRAFLRMNGHRG
jgi:hypothetical protein